MKVYVASSWRNTHQQRVVRELRETGHEVYDFRNPPHGRGGFQWSEIDKHWQDWSAEKYRRALETPIAEAGYRSDMDAMEWADACVLVLPCGRSAHLEAGWFAGRGKPVIVLTRDGEEPELMAKMLTAICVDMFEVKHFLKIAERNCGPSLGSDPCLDCDGSGKDDLGGPCVHCDGTGGACDE